MTENFDQVLRDDFVEAFQERVDLLLYHSVHLVVAQLLEVVVLIFVCYFDVDAALTELLMFNLAKVVRINAKVHLVIFNVILERPFIASVCVVIKVFLILEGQFFTDHHLIEGLREITLQ